jgi:hypothetical protein
MADMGRVTVPEAAQRLDITKNAVHKRIQRHTIEWELEPAKEAPPEPRESSVTSSKESGGNGGGWRRRPESGALLVDVQVLLRAVPRPEAERSKGFWYRLLREGV